MAQDRELVVISERLFAPLDPKSPSRLWRQLMLDHGLFAELHPDEADPDDPSHALARLQAAVMALDEAESAWQLARRPDPFRVSSPQARLYALPVGVFLVFMVLSDLITAMVMTVLLSGAAAIAGLIRLWTVEDRRRKEELEGAEAALSTARADLVRARREVSGRAYALSLPRRVVACLPAREQAAMARDLLAVGSPEREELAALVRACDDMLASLRATPPEHWAPLEPPDANTGAP